MDAMSHTPDPVVAYGTPPGTTIIARGLAASVLFSGARVGRRPPEIKITRRRVGLSFEFRVWLTLASEPDTRARWLWYSPGVDRMSIAAWAVAMAMHLVRGKARVPAARVHRGG